MLGCDYAGTVVKVGPKVTKSLAPGDRICGCAHGANFDEPFDGVFAQFAMVKGDVQMKIPDSLTFEQAATLPLGVMTVGQGLYQKALKLDLPAHSGPRDEWILIYGGSSATGSLGIQFAKMYDATPDPNSTTPGAKLVAGRVTKYLPRPLRRTKLLSKHSALTKLSTIPTLTAAGRCKNSLTMDYDSVGTPYQSKVPSKFVARLFHRRLQALKRTDSVFSNSVLCLHGRTLR